MPEANANDERHAPNRGESHFRHRIVAERPFKRLRVQQSLTCRIADLFILQTAFCAILPAKFLLDPSLPGWPSNPMPMLKPMRGALGSFPQNAAGIFVQTRSLRVGDLRPNGNDDSDSALNVLLERRCLVVFHAFS